MQQNQRTVCTQLDYMFSLAPTGSREINEEIICTTKYCVKKIEMKWNELYLSLLGRKIHATCDHLVPLMEKWEGIRCFGEDFIKKGYQVGKREKYRTGNIANHVRAAILHSQNEYATQVPEIETDIMR